MDKDIALTILLEHVVKPHLKHSSFVDVSFALNIVAAMTVLTGKAWTLAPHLVRRRTWIIIEWTVS